MIKWLSEEWLTIVSIVLSGLISWLISAVYFYKGNRSSLQMSILIPILDILSDKVSKRNYIDMYKISTSYSAKYLHKSEKRILFELLEAYKEISLYKDSVVKTDIVLSYFEYVLKNNKINSKPVPVWVDGEIVADDYPPDFHQLGNDIERCFSDEYLYTDSKNLENTVKSLLLSYSHLYYTEEHLPIFEDYNLEQVLKKSKIMNNWNEKFDLYDIAKLNFKNLKIIKDLIAIKEH